MDCEIVLEDLEKGSAACENLTSGVKRLIVFQTKDVQQWPTKTTSVQAMEDYVNMNGDIIMKSGRRGVKVYSKTDVGVLTYAIQGEEGGKSQRASLKIYSPGFKAKLLGFMAAVQNADICILALMNNGDWHLLGDKDRGAVLSEGEATSGDASTSANGGDLTFTYDTPAACIYMGQVESITEVGGTPATIETEDETSGTGGSVTLNGKCTDADGVVTKVGFMYKKEGTDSWTEVTAGPFTSGSTYSKTISSLSTGDDYIYCAFMVVGGRKYYGNDIAFTA